MDRRRGRLPRVARTPAVVRRRGRVGAARSRRNSGASAGHPRQLPGRHRDQGPRGPLPRHQPALPRAAGHRPGHDDRAHRTRRLPCRGRRRAPLPRPRGAAPRAHAAGRGDDGALRRPPRLPHAEVPDARRGRQGLRRRPDRDGRDRGAAQRGGAQGSRGAAASRRPPREHRAGSRAASRTTSTTSSPSSATTRSSSSRTCRRGRRAARTSSRSAARSTAPRR